MLIYVLTALLFALSLSCICVFIARRRADSHAKAILPQKRFDLTLARAGLAFICLSLANCAGGPPDTPQPKAQAAAQTAPSGIPWSGPGLQPAPAIPGAPVRIGLLLPLSGPRAGTGQDILLAAEMALFDFNDSRLLLMPVDTKGARDGAARAARQALNQGADILLGPLFSEEVAAAADIARGSGRPMIAFSSDRQVAGNGVYLLSFSPEQEVNRVISFAATRGHRRFAALMPRSPYGERVAEAFMGATAGLEGATRKLVYYLPDSKSLHAPIRQLTDYDTRHQAWAAETARLEQSGRTEDQQKLAELKSRDTLGEADFDALLIAASGAHLRAIGRLLAEYGIGQGKVRYLGTGLWDDPAAQAEASLMGGWFPASQPPAGSNLAARMQAGFNIRLTPVISLGYDAVALVATLAAGAGDPAARFSAQALTSPAGFAGVTGIFRLRPDGLTERALAIREIQPQDATVIDAAPMSFSPLVN